MNLSAKISDEGNVASSFNLQEHNNMANAIRFLAIDAVEAANSGHPGMPMGMADVVTVLFRDFLKFNPKNPQWPDRDRFVLSAGHGSMLLYALLYLTGYEDCTLEQIKNFRQLGAKTAGHPEFGHLDGIETTTGPLGQGFANAVGMALAEEMMAARFGRNLVNHKTYVIAGDGDLMEGISHEAASMAGHLRLKNLVVLFDDNGISIDGSTSLAVSDNQILRFESYGWRTESLDGHNPAEIAVALKRAQTSDKPSFIACKTRIGFGSPNKEGSEKCHGSALGSSEAQATRDKLGWSHQPFVIPEDIKQSWRKAGERGVKINADWQENLTQAPKDLRKEFERLLNKELPFPWAEEVAHLKKEFAESKPKQATRKSSQVVLEKLTAKIPELIGGSADLTGSNNTKTAVTPGVSAENFAGRYIHYGVREHAMAAVMNGMALHGEFIPYGGTFLVFADYCRPSIRLAALMKQRVIFVMTHDSIGLGEDGPTHQPVEHLASLRAIPGLDVYRPADAAETAECWALAIARQDGPSLIALSRQDLPTVRNEYTAENKCSLGGYILKESSLSDGHEPKVALISSGSEVEIVLKAQEILEDKGIPTRVVSMPCTQLFEHQGEGYRRNVLGDSTLRVAVEAASQMGWDRYIGKYGIFIGMNDFGASAPAGDLYKHFGITAERIVEEVLERV